MNSLYYNETILNANYIKEEDGTFENVDFRKEDIDPLDIGSQNEDDKVCFDIGVKSQVTEEFVDTNVELLLVEDGIVSEGFGCQSADVSKVPLAVIKEENECVVEANFIKDEMDPFNIGSQNEDCGGCIEVKMESDDDPQPSTSSGEAMNVLGKKYLRIKIRELSKSKLTQAAVESSFESDICLRSFDSKQSFKRNFSCHFQNKKFMCNICEKRFTTKRYLNDHMRIHSGEKPFECDVCDRRFTHKHGLTIHLRNHSGERPFECDVCKKRFVDKQGLKIHLRIHSGERPFECDVCEKRFTQKQDLKRHFRIHSGERPFECDVCEKKFTRKQGLIIHLRNHSGERPFECNICNKRFVEKQNLKAHMRIHENLRGYNI